MFNAVPTMEHDEVLAENVYLTVHNYQKRSDSSDDSILDKAQKLVDKVNFQWISAKIKTHVVKLKSTQCFVYCILPPSVSNEHNSPVILKAWGDTASENEIYTLDSLEDFLQTDLTHIFDQRAKILSELDVSGTVISPKDTMLQRHDIAAYTPEGGPRKKRRLDTQSLYHRIPQPHMHPSPYLPTEVPVVARPFEPVLPTSNSFSEETRVAWVVPVRGVFPWEECSSAVLLDESEGNILPSYNEIVWTRSTLLEFWDFLLDLRASAAMGALGISFHSRQSARRLEMSSSDLKMSVNASSHDSSARLLMMTDYIKVYHNHSRRLHLRRLLAEWNGLVEIPGIPKTVLRDAHLPLLNDVSQIIQVL